MNSGFEKGVYSRAIIVYILHQIIFHSKIQRFFYLSNIFPMVCSLHFYSSFKKTLVESPFIFFINRSSKDDPKLQITKSHWVLFSCIYLWIQMYLMTSEFISVKIIKPWWVETRRWSCCPFFLLFSVFFPVTPAAGGGAPTD